MWSEAIGLWGLRSGLTIAFGLFPSRDRLDDDAAKSGLFSVAFHSVDEERGVLWQRRVADGNPDTAPELGVRYVDAAAFAVCHDVLA